MKKFAVALSLGVALAAPAFAINKCTLPGGKVVYQDTSCDSGIDKAETVQHLNVNTLGDGSGGGSVVNLADSLSLQLANLKGAVDSLETDASSCEIGLKVYGRKPEASERCDRYFRGVKSFSSLVDDYNRLVKDGDLRQSHTVDFAHISRAIDRINSEIAFINRQAS